MSAGRDFGVSLPVLQVGKPDGVLDGSILLLYPRPARQDSSNLQPYPGYAVKTAKSSHKMAARQPDIPLKPRILRF